MLNSPVLSHLFLSKVMPDSDMNHDDVMMIVILCLPRLGYKYSRLEHTTCDINYSSLEHLRYDQVQSNRKQRVLVNGTRSEWEPVSGEYKPWTKHGRNMDDPWTTGFYSSGAALASRFIAQALRR